MRLESALYTSREGLITSGQAISVIGDNISNSNTTGYKRSRTEFADLVSMGEDHKCEVLKGVGSGAAVNNVRTIFNETGLIEFTGRSLDVGIQGHGFLMVGEATNPMFTRAGNLVMRSDGILITPEGNPVLGYAPGGNTLQNLDMLSLSLNGNITTTSKVFGNLTASDKISTPPNNPATFSEIAKTANFMSNFRVFDSLGEGHDVTIAFTKTGPGAWNAQAYMDGGETGKEKGVPVKLGNDATLTFSSNGSIEAANKDKAIISANTSYSNGAAAGNFTIDLSQFTQLSTSNQINGFDQDGQGGGQIKDYEIHENGDLFAVLDTGSTVQVGTIPLASFNNPDALERVGNNLLRMGEGAGEMKIGIAGTSIYGSLQGGGLERSTVDIADQFVDLVLFQRGYQANSQILNATSTLLKETLSLLR